MKHEKTGISPFATASPTEWKQIISRALDNTERIDGGSAI